MQGRDVIVLTLGYILRGIVVCSFVGWLGIVPIPRSPESRITRTLEVRFGPSGLTWSHQGQGYPIKVIQDSVTNPFPLAHCCVSAPANFVTATRLFAITIDDDSKR
jgi:hypothetical protein